MDAVEYLKNKERCVCRSSCSRCPFDSTNNGKNVECEDLEAKYPETAVEIIEKWSAEHPVKTRQSEFLKLFPRAAINKNGMISICPRLLDTTFKCPNVFNLPCESCIKDYWGFAEVSDERGRGVPLEHGSERVDIISLNEAMKTSSWLAVWATKPESLITVVMSYSDLKIIYDYLLDKERKKRMVNNDN